VHTCDKRRTRSWIHERFPDFDFETGFSEEDLLWDPDVRETKADVVERARRALDYIFEDSAAYCAFGSCLQTYFDGLAGVSVTAHGGIINGFLQAIGRQPFGLPTGGKLVLDSRY